MGWKETDTMDEKKSLFSDAGTGKRRLQKFAGTLE
jgi:hypothetical protein